MALTLIKEDGTGKADANAYAKAADGDAYHEGHLYASAWTVATTAKKEAALVFATRLIDVVYQFNGVRTLSGQTLQWPRMDCREPDGTTAQFVAGGDNAVVPMFIIPGSAGKIIVVDNPMLVPGNVVPKAVVEGTCELARELLIADRTATPPGEGLKYYNEAGTQTGYDKEDRRPIISPVVQALLAKYGSLVNAKSGAVRLVRT
jgi:hypothetical protein